MAQFRRLALACVLTAAAVAVLASGAAANTFYANTRGEDKDHLHCEHQGIDACNSIAEAIAQAELVPGASTIVVQGENGEGATFKETEALELASSSVNGLTITGEEPHIKVIGPTGKATLALTAAAGTITVSDLTLEGAAGPVATITDHGANLKLQNVLVEASTGSALNGIEAEKGGSLTMEGGGVEMENNNGYDIVGVETPVSIDDAGLLNALASGDEAGGVYSARTGLTIDNTKIATGSGTNSQGIGIHAIQDGSVTLQNDTVQQSDDKADGVVLELSPASVDGLTIEMTAAEAKTTGLEVIGAAASSTDVEHLTVDGGAGGGWGGPAAIGRNGTLEIADSHLTANPTATTEALGYASEAAGGSLLLQRSVVKAGAGSTLGALLAVDGDVTVDSSEILGAVEAIRFLSIEGQAHTLTVDASTIDAGPAGTAADAFGDLAIKAGALAKPPTTATVDVEGSIMLEPSDALSEEGGQSSIACSHSTVPSQSVAASGPAGAVDCASGTAGNEDLTSELPSLFSEPIANYALIPSSAAVDSVPSAAIALPAGIAASTTDLAGNPRTVLIGSNGACAAYQDRGALQVPGQAGACTPARTPVSPTAPASPVAVAHAAVLSALALSPSSFYPAPSGATISRHRRYGTTVSYGDSEPAVTTFTVLLASTGRAHGHSCGKPSSSNRHGRRCTYYRALGSFTHSDTAGAARFHFSGRLHGRPLARGRYRLSALARNANGASNPATAAFTVS